jgi:hypothetical protein
MKLQRKWLNLVAPRISEDCKEGHTNNAAVEEDVHTVHWEDDLSC